MALMLNAQKMIYDRLTTALPGQRVYDDVPNLPDGQPASDFPYITVGDDMEVPWDTDDTLGSDITFVLHVWSRYQGKKEVKTIMQNIYNALHRQVAALDALATGVRVVDCLHEFSQIFELGDGATRHGVCRYRLRIEKE
mgnify:CR=1 FL=1